MDERNAAPGSGDDKQAEGVASGNEKAQDEGQRGTEVTQERVDGTFVGGKDRLPPSTPAGGKEQHVVETGMPADLVEEKPGPKQDGSS